jgi:uncharacterized protein YbjT (DUF2867 family)
MIRTALVVGASGATGRRLVHELLGRGWRVRAIVRSPAGLETLAADPRLTLVQGSVLDLSDEVLATQVDGCEALASCLGHNPTFRGIYGEPRRLVTETTRRLCQVIEARGRTLPVRFVLMNTAGIRNRDLAEPLSLAHRWALGMVRALVPPHADNEQAADFLRTVIGRHDPRVEWVVVRPDSLIDEPEVTAYETHPSPMRNAIFDAGKTSRINVAHFMADLMTRDDIWCRWRYQMPVIYNGDRFA